MHSVGTKLGIIDLKEVWFQLKVIGCKIANSETQRENKKEEEKGSERKREIISILILLLLLL